ncbi:MAG: hypothetical protein KKF58_06950 [Gammaproteobacteria bacterium]|nr:hypothetical protein [Gammaproteobacteria bacterium]MBU1448034.1 hypothetical protein [Gammaproteobacteria bacterium]
MAGEMEKLFALAGRIHVLLRREHNRIIDVEWMCNDESYAREVLKLARSAESEELLALAERVEEVHPLLPRPQRIEAAIPPKAESKYVASLR